MQLNLLNIEEVKDVAEDVSEDMEPRLGLIAEWAEQWAERYLGTRFKAESREEFHTGGLPYIEPHVLPLVAITSIMDSFGDGEALTADEDYTIREQLIYKGSSTGPPFCWLQGANRHKLIYVGGYLGTLQDPIPDGAVHAPSGIKFAVLSAVRRIWQSSGGVKNDSELGVSWDELMSGEIISMLDPFRLKVGD